MPVIVPKNQYPMDGKKLELKILWFIRSYLVIQIKKYGVEN